MNPTVGFFCKSFRGDFEPLRQLLETFERHNPEGLQLTLSLPSEDVPIIDAQIGRDLRNVRILSDESYCGIDLREFGGWRAQQICKLLSWKVMDAAHYAILDSDCYFIRDVRATDLLPCGGASFIACASYIRTVMKADNVNLIAYLNGSLTPGPEWFPAAPETITDRLSEFIAYKDLSQENPDAIARSSIPMKIFGGKRWLFCQPGQIFSRALVEKLCAFFAQYGLTVGDAIKICPWEYNWYGEYAATQGFADTEFRISPVIHFQTADDIAFARQNNITQELLSKKFSFVQMAARHIPDLTF